MANGLRIKHTNRLPAELRQRNSDLDVMITLAGDAAEKRSFGFDATVKTTRRLIRQNCPSYRPSTSSDFDILCRSGEDTGDPYCGSKCYMCRAGQFTASGMFTGEVTGEDHLERPMPTPVQLVNINDAIKAVEQA
jgi:hypothetical protein